MYYHIIDYVTDISMIRSISSIKVHKFAHLKEKKYSSCRIEVILYEIFTMKYQHFSIKIILIEVKPQILPFSYFFFALQILFKHICIMLYINYKF